MKKTSSPKINNLFIIGRHYHLLFLLLFGYIGIQAQETQVAGKLRIKLTEEMAATFEATPLQKSTSGTIRVGTVGLNKLHTQFSATSYKRVFPDGGKFEKKHRKYGLHLWYEIDIDKGQDVEEASAAYHADSNVVLAEPIMLTRRIETLQSDQTFSQQPSPKQRVLEDGTNDPLFPDQWHYHNTGQDSELGIGADISLLEAWKLETGNPDIIVSVHDGGIQTNHEDLIDNLWVNTGEIPDNGIDDDNNGYIDDIHGYDFVDGTGTITRDNHGTHTAGTVGATTNNAIGVSGVAGGDGSGNGVRLMSCAVFTDDGSGGFAQSYIYAADNGAVISQNSWGHTIPEAYSESYYDAIRYFIAEAGYDELGNPIGPMQGGLVIFAAGNDSSNLKYYPGAFEEVIAVGSTDSDDSVSYFSNWGDWVDLAAPGRRVWSTIGYRNDRADKYDYYSGTSMACPHVSGVAALIVSKFAGNIGPEEVRHRLLGTTDEMPFDMLGSGRLNAFAALQDNDALPPEAITDLTVTESVQNIVSYTWTAPSDPGNGSAYNYEIRYSKDPITDNNYEDAIVIEQNILASKAGSIETFSSAFDVSTTYYFAIKAMDYFGNVSDISNVVMATTASAPLIQVSHESLNFDMDVSTGGTNQVDIITVNNIGDAVLTYNSSLYEGYVNQLYPGSELDRIDMARYGEVSTSTSNKDYKLQTIKKEVKETVVSKTSLLQKNLVIKDSIFYDDGDEDYTFFLGNPFVPTAFAVRFEVDQPSFELTHVRNYMDIEDVNSEFLPVGIEIRKGPSIGDSELLLSQEVMPDEGLRDGFLTVPLTKSQSFTQGDVFWVIHKFSIIYEYPQAIENPDTFPLKPDTYYYSSNGGVSYIEDDYSYITRAISAFDENEDTMIFLSPEGESISVNPNNATEVSAACDVTNVPNGEFKFTVIIDSNDPQQVVTHIPCEVTVSGQVPVMSVSTQLLNFDITILEVVSEEEIRINNNGLGDLEINFTSDNSVFEVVDAVIIPPGEEGIVPVTFTPVESGITYGAITLASNDPNTPEVSVQVVGVASVPPVIELAPSFVESTLDIGQNTTEKFTINNTGNYPLTFSFPEFAIAQRDNLSNTQNKDANSLITKDSGTDNDFGYSWMDSNEFGGPVYVWNDIKNSGTEINIGDVKDTGIDLPFVFNFYGDAKEKVQIHSDGVLYFGDPENYESYGIYGVPNEYNDLHDFIAVFYHSSYTELVGNIYYKLTDNALIVQYEQVGREVNEEGTGTFQVVLLESGNILFYYKDMGGLSGLSEDNPNIIGVENSLGTDGLAIYYEDDDFTVDDEVAVMITPKKANFITNVTPVTGVVAPGSSMNINVTLDTGNETEGIYKNDLLVSSNDPSNSYVWFQATLNINGEQEQVVAAPEFLMFENTFIGNDSNAVFTVKNPGTANLIIESVTSDNDQFIVDVETPFELEPYEELEVSVTFIPTVAITTEAIITVETNMLNSDPLIVPVSGEGINPPVINIGTTVSYDKEAYSGEKVSDVLYVKNEGESTLQYLVKTPTWSYIDDGTDSSPSNGIDEYGYRWKDNKKGASDVIYDFIDISTTGIDITDDISSVFPGTGSAKVNIGFDFQFYDNVYSDIWVSSRGLLYFGDDQMDRDDIQGNKIIPRDDSVNNIIAGIWESLNSSGETYYQSFDEYFVVQYTNKFLFSEDQIPDSQFTMQIILYPNGNIKFQYKDIANENFSSSYTIGIENNAGDDGMMIAYSSRENYIQNGLAVLIKRPIQRFIDVGESIELPIIFDAANLNKGEYAENFNIVSNDPLNNDVAIPASFTVFGDPTIEVDPNEVDFGEVILITDATEAVTEAVTINNIGSDTLVIEAISTDNDEFSVSFNEAISIEPSESAMIDITLLSDTFGEFSGNLLIASNDIANGDLSIPVRAQVVDSPILLATTENDTIYAKVRVNGLANKSITLNNNATLGTLTYDAIPNYLQIDTEFLDNQNLNSNAMLDQANTRQARYATVDSLHYSIKTVEEGNVFGFDNESLTAATKFVVGNEENFKLTHIRNYHNPGTSQDPIILKIYRGGETPNEGQLLLTQQHEPQESAGLELIALDTPQLIRAGETFWITITYPISVDTYPQGIIYDGIYQYYQTFYYSIDYGSSWTPMEYYYRTAQFQIRALGSKHIDWIELSPDQGEVFAGDDSDIDVQLDATGLNSGTYYANINFASNDVNNSSINIPVRMTVNEVPEFYEKPIDTIRISENETIEVVLRANDSDGEVVSYKLEESYDNVSFESSSEMAKITFTPDYTQSGYYTFTVSALDDFDDIASTSFVVEVIDDNRAPFLIKEIPRQIYINRRRLRDLDLSDYIQDPDMDVLSYTVTVTNPDLLEFEIDGDMLSGEPLGRGRTLVSIIASDGKGGEVGTSFRAIAFVIGRNTGPIKTSGEFLNTLGEGMFNHPNPFVDETTIFYYMEKEAHVRLEIFSYDGKLVNVLIDKKEEAGDHEILLKRNTMAAGIYFYKIHIDGQTTSNKMIIK
ncbi:S8 family serine peptidase [uncultured Aquimarina sp.]|uniref:S8 family serine peptidase n=1 Tax=uncultured Aquimarina sp. TaxID=575652 RepID=UPI00260E9788|nr:S8 family serine peptidase [uncultured Aquimarina sp.]